MKKLLLILAALFLLSFSSTAGASPRHHHDWSHEAYHRSTWHHATYTSVSISWHERHDRYDSHRYRMERIYDHEWGHRFPGLRAYRWHDRHGDGFWYHGRRVTDAVFFYDRDDSLVSIGFMHNGSFIFIRDDESSFENRDSFFLSWWSR
jgi:hypothetical protein